MTFYRYEIIYLNGGKGTRTWPLALLDPFIFLSKSMFRLYGFTQFESQVYEHRSEGAQKLHIVAKEDENRDQLLERIHQHDGHIYGFRSRSWTHPVRDPENTGSAMALCQAILDQPDLEGLAIVLPNDNFFDYDIQDALRQHVESDSVITVLTADVPAKDAKRYGLIKQDGTRILEMGEKLDSYMKMSSLLEMQVDADTLVPVSGGAYIVDVTKLREIINQEWVKGYMDGVRKFDIAGQLIPGILQSGGTIGPYTLNSWADLGGLDLLLDTMRRVFRGEFPYFAERLREEDNYVELPGNVWIHKKTYYEIYIGGKNLEQLMRSDGDDRVTIGPNVYIGNNCMIYPGAVISDSNIEMDSKIGTNSMISGSYISPGTQIAENVTLESSITSQRSKIGPYASMKKSVIGAKVNVPTGVQLDEVVVWPLYKFEQENISYTKGILLNEALMQASLATLEPGRECYWPSQLQQEELMQAVANF